MSYFLIALIRSGEPLKRHVILAPSMSVAEIVAKDVAHYEGYSEYIVSDLQIEATP